jgi:hypothetical protein
MLETNDQVVPRAFRSFECAMFFGEGCARMRLVITPGFQDGWRERAVAAV